jgi:hypothetical protein
METEDDMESCVVQRIMCRRKTALPRNKTLFSSYFFPADRSSVLLASVLILVQGYKVLETRRPQFEVSLMRKSQNLYLQFLLLKEMCNPEEGRLNSLSMPCQ